jgi:type I restriction enzyme S subunit
MNKTALKDVSKKISSGLTPLRSNERFWSSPDIPWVKTEQLGTKNIYDSNEKFSKEVLSETSIKLNPVNTISIAMYGEGKTRGSVSILKTEMTTNQACCNIVLDQEVADYEYVYYFLTTQYNELRNLSSGVRKNLNSNDIKNFEIRLPSCLSEQRAIAGVLSAIDKKIELNNKINAELEAMAKLIYDYWFVQFDFPDANGKPYKSSGGSMVYNEALKHEIPEGWGSEYIENLLAKESRTKKLPKTHYKDQGDYAIIDQSTDFICGYTDDKDTVIEAKVPRIVFGDHTRILKLVNFDFARGADGTQVLLSNNNNVPQHFFYHSLLKIDLSSYGYARHFKFLKQTRTIVPDANTANQFEEAATSFYSQVRHNIFETKRLEELRDWLLPMLMNGQVRVKS